MSNVDTRQVVAVCKPDTGNKDLRNSMREFPESWAECVAAEDSLDDTVLGNPHGG